MSDSYEFRPGTTPVLVSMPHGGTDLPAPILERLSEPARPLPDTDWHIPRLYEFAADLGASMVTARYRRYVIDLNRPPDDERLYAGQATTGLCPDLLFDGAPLYADGRRISEEYFFDVSMT
jgi:N-formylglutamate deformylase